MSKESLYGIDTRCIFRETFNSEQATRKNGGEPNNIDYSKGVGTFNGDSSIIHYLHIIDGVYTCRFKVNLTNFNEASVLLDNRYGSADGDGTIFVSAGILTSDSGTNYVNGVQTSTVTAGVDLDIVVTGITFTNIASNWALGGNYATSTNSLFLGDYELLEIYEGTLTAEEVSNLAEGKTYHELPDKIEAQLGDEEVINGTFDSASGWTIPSGVTINSGQVHFDNTVSNGTGLVQTWTSLIGKKVRVTYEITNYTSGTLKLYDNSWSSIAGNAVGIYEEELTVVGNQLRLYASGSFIGSVDNVSVKELIAGTGIEKILDVHSLQGAHANKFSGDFSENIVINGDFDTDTDWTKGTGWTIADGKASHATGTASNLSQVGLNISASELVRVTYIILDMTAGTFRSQVSGGGGGSGITITSDGTYTEDIIAGTAAAGGIYFVASSDFNGSLDNVSVRKVIPEIIDTDVDIKKIGTFYSPEYNGSTSKTDAGSYDDLTGDITILSWINPQDSMEGGSGRVLENGKLMFALEDSTFDERVAFLSNGSNATGSANNSIIFNNKYKFITITRTADAVTNFYINSILSGNANQDGTSIVAGTTDITIGNNDAQNKSFSGSISRTIIYKGLLTTKQITQFWTATKGRYGQ